MKVLVTGICGRLGKELCRALHREHQVVGVDRRPFAERPKDVIHVPVDLRKRQLQDVFRTERPDAVIHLGVMHDPRMSAAEHHEWNVVGLGKLLEYAAKYEVKKLIVLSSANVYGPAPDNPQFLDEGRPLLSGARANSMRDLIDVDTLTQGFFWKHPSTETVILRPVHILGKVRNAPSNYFRLSPTPTLLGFDPMVQVMHELDVIQCLTRSLAPGVRGIFNVAGPDALPLSEAIRLAGRTALPVPHSLLTSMMKKMWSLRLTNFPVPELDHIRYVCMVRDERAREALGYAPRFGIKETMRAIDVRG